MAAAVLTPGSGTYIMADAMMTAAGASLQDVRDAGGQTLPLNYAQGVDGLRSGRVNMLAVNGPANHPTVQDFARQGQFLVLEEDVIDTVVSNLPGSVHATLPAGTYSFLEEDYDTFAVYTSLVISEDVPDDVVYAITKHFWENVDEFRAVGGFARVADIENATVGGDSLPIHPGALRYYREAGVAD